jgi:hypothetical protein
VFLREIATQCILAPLHSFRIVFLGCLAAACHDEATQHCQDVMTSAQELVKSVDGKDATSVAQSLTAVNQAIDACTQAKRTSEVDSLTRAKNELSAQADYLKKKASHPARKKQTPEEITALTAKGDPSCPKGQAYKPDPNGKEIRCTGPQIVDMGFAAAQSYFDGRGYKLTTSDTPPSLTAEYGAEKFVFEYDAPKDERPPRCLMLYPAPGIPYQEATGRATGVLMKKIDKDGVVKTAHGDMPIHVDESDTTLIISLGTCAK